MSEWGCFAVLILGYLAMGVMICLVHPVVGAIYLIGMPLVAALMWRIA